MVPDAGIEPATFGLQIRKFFLGLAADTRDG
jgi:hypothetical protein